MRSDDDDEAETYPSFGGPFAEGGLGLFLRDRLGLLRRLVRIDTLDELTAVGHDFEDVLRHGFLRLFLLLLHHGVALLCHLEDERE